MTCSIKSGFYVSEEFSHHKDRTGYAMPWKKSLRIKKINKKQLEPLIEQKSLIKIQVNYIYCYY